MIEFHDVSKTFAGEPAVSNLDLTFAEGAFSVLVGTSGSGKVRFINGQSIERLAYTMRHLKVANQWQTPKEFWVQQALKFACAPGSRAKNDMAAVGKMEYLQMIEMLQQMFFKLAPIQQKSQMMDNIDSLLELKK